MVRCGLELGNERQGMKSRCDGGCRWRMTLFESRFPLSVYLMPRFFDLKFALIRWTLGRQTSRRFELLASVKRLLGTQEDYFVRPTGFQYRYRMEMESGMYT
jgi:hypothetical protein